MARHARILALCVLSLLTLSGAALAADSDQTAKPKAKHHADHKGGYSYTAAQTTNTSGDARGRYGAADSLRDPNIDRQTNFGPFDHGFFFESGGGPGQHGGDSPYMH